jgi:WD40 repeat protein
MIILENLLFHYYKQIMCFKSFVVSIIVFTQAFSLRAQDSIPLKVFIGHSEGVNSIDLSPDGNFLISGSKDETVRLWNTSTGEVVKSISMKGSSVKRVRFNHSGTKFLAALYTRFAEIDAKSFKGRFSKKNTHSSFVETCLYSNDDKYILTSSWRDNSLMAWKAENLKPHIKTQEVTWVDNAIFNKNNTLIFSGGHDNLAKIWDFQTGNLIRSFAGHDDWVYDVCLSLDEKFLYTASFDKTIKKWDLATNKNILTFSGHKEGIVTLALSPDGKYLASAGVDAQIIIWDVDLNKEIKRIKAHEAAVMDLKFSSDGKVLYSASMDKSIKAWKLSAL